MSDTADDIGFHGRQLLNKSKTESLRAKMREFAAEQNPSDLKTLRSTVSEGDALSDIVKDDRDERL